MQASLSLPFSSLPVNCFFQLSQKKVSLIVKVVRVLGFKCAMQILDDTRKIEKQGGMLTMDGTRR